LRPRSRRPRRVWPRLSQTRTSRKSRGGSMTEPPRCS
jgi:hypothetical protein